MARRTKAEAAETKEALLDAAEQVFLEVGVTRASLEQISRCAGLTRGALYWHFRNKEDLFRAMINRVSIPFQELISGLDDPTLADRPLDAIRLACHAGARQLDTPRHRRVHGILLHHCERTSSFDPMSIKDEFVCETHHTLLQHFREAYSKGQLREDLTPELATDIFHYSLSGMFWEWLRAPEAFSLSQRGPVLIDKLIDMMRRSSPQ
ncbi:TetR family transcriptional regulator [Halomonas binhaiensis]|uniref:TetR family transcriptional regulator n=1 Tax=Halomonas binhaiensis TaxID=2562282 RepID=A0A5C1NKR5_9GAMM|nr:TetR family transcriptional regulator [Halomonas binhaiensis]QEM82429.1 TetR family transcriptional regulator [Halomonas binhaiensis]